MSTAQLEKAIGDILGMIEDIRGRSHVSGRFCGIRTPVETFEQIVEKLKKNFEVYRIKTRNPDLPLVVSLEGGTGTGKSMIFNALAGREISRAGSERPKTFGPILYCHKKHEQTIRTTDLPAGYQKDYLAAGRDGENIEGNPLEIKVVCHDDTKLERFFLIDTPDSDSVEALNRFMAEDIYNLSDIVVFVTSQEKYGDMIPFDVFKRALADGKHFLVVMNKVDSSEAVRELKQRIAEEARMLTADSLFFTLPWIASDSPFDELKNHHVIRQLRKEIFEQEEKVIAETRKKEISNVEKKLAKLAENLVRILEKEQETIGELLASFRSIYDETEKKLLEESLVKLDDTTRQHIRNEIRKIFQRYDLLRKPRAVISKILRFPLSLLGLVPGSEEERRKRDLERLHRKIDLSALHMAVNELNRRIHNEVRVSGIEYLQKTFLAEDVSMAKEEIDALFFSRQEKLEEWLQSRFEELTEGIPRHKEWGIYSTTILWSLFLISVETVVGGGLSMFEAILDSVIMPFLSKGAVEIFAYQELKNVAEELDRRYRKQLTEVLEEQYRRYASKLERCALSEEDFTRMEKLLAEVRILPLRHVTF